MSAIDPSIVGARLNPRNVRVDWRKTSNFAAGLADANPKYLNDALPGGLVAPPQYAVALSWPMVATVADSLGDRIDPQLLMTMVHFAERIRLHRLVRPGDELRLSGEVVGVFPSKSGARIVLRVEATDSSERPVFTEHITGLLRGVGCEGEGRGSDACEGLASACNVDEALWETAVFIPPEAPYVYDACSDIVFPIHTSPAFATAVGLPGIIYQGTATLGRAITQLVNRECAADPGKILEIAGRFGAMVRPGETIRVRLLDRFSEGENEWLCFDVLNEAGKAAIANGAVLVARDG